MRARLSFLLFVAVVLIALAGTAPIAATQNQQAAQAEGQGSQTQQCARVQAGAQIPRATFSGPHGPLHQRDRATQHIYADI